MGTSCSKCLGNSNYATTIELRNNETDINSRNNHRKKVSFSLENQYKYNHHKKKSEGSFFGLFGNSNSNIKSILKESNSRNNHNINSFNDFTNTSFTLKHMSLDNNFKNFKDIQSIIYKTKIVQNKSNINTENEKSENDNKNIYIKKNGINIKKNNNMQRKEYRVFNNNNNFDALDNKLNKEFNQVNNNKDNDDINEKK